MQLNNLQNPQAPAYTCYPYGQQYPQAAYYGYNQYHGGALPPTMPYQQAAMPYQQYHCYPTGPGATAGAPQAALPSSNSSGEVSKTNKETKTSKNLWVGRTKAQVDEDNIKVAMRENVYKYDAMKPKDAKPDQLFWVVELDQSTTLRMYKTIDEDLGPGKWERDPRHGNAYFVREEEKKEKM